MHKLIKILMILAVTASCTERVDIDLEDSQTRLVVYGNITSDRTTHYVELTTTSSYYYNQPPPPVTGAIVEIDDNEGDVIRLTETEPGVYATPEDYFAASGKTYTLNITLDEPIDENKYYTASSTTVPAHPIDSISLTSWPDFGDEGYYSVDIYYQDPPTEDYYLFDLYKNQDYLTDSIVNKAVSDDLLYDGNYLWGAQVAFLDQSYERHKIHPGDTIIFRAGFISEDYTNFIWTLQEEVSFSTPMFSGPPANVKGNISNGAVGYFAVFTVTYSGLVVK